MTKNLGKLHGSNRQNYTGGIYRGNEVSHIAGNDRFGAMYPFMSARSVDKQGYRSHTGMNIGVEHIGGGY